MSFAIRPLEGLAELHAAVALQESTWGDGFSERVPASLMKVALRLGGVASGAFDEGGRLVGFVFGITGLERGGLAHWSDILAVSPELRDSGLGRALKLHQRERVLDLGVDVMYWTFDPLESRNAWLNLERLGAVCAEYVPDMYGASDSPLHRGLGTDRFVVRWDLTGERIARCLEGRRATDDPGAALDLPAAFAVADGASGPEPVEPWTVPEAPLWRVPIPADIQSLKTAAPELAASWRRATRAVLDPPLRGGAEVRGLVRAGPVSHYLVLDPRA